MSLYHGVTLGPIVGKPRLPFFMVAHEHMAKWYSDNVVEVDYAAANPLILRTGSEFENVWNNAGADLGWRWHPDGTARLARWAIDRGYDAIVILPSVFGDEFNKARMTLCHPQIVALKDAWIRRQ